MPGRDQAHQSPRVCRQPALLVLYLRVVIVGCSLTIMGICLLALQPGSSAPAGPAATAVARIGPPMPCRADVFPAHWLRS